MNEGNVTREAKIEFLNDLDIGLLDIYCEHRDLRVIINNGRITDYTIEKEVIA